MKKIGTAICLFLAILFLAIGISKEQPQSVLAKASKICLECIGIG
jgi:uncharacterized membrane protein